MSKPDIRCENKAKSNIFYRASLRGIKKCTSCGYINGQRALLCRNVNCDLRKKKLEAIKPFDPIMLTTFGDIKLLSLRTKENLLQPRNFVKIVEPMHSQPSAVCYVDSCKYAALDTSHLVCCHIKACRMLTNVPKAEVYPIDKSVLWNLNIHAEKKHRLWKLYQLEEKLMAPVQKLSSSMFVVKCIESKNFQAGCLHVTVFSDAFPKKRRRFFCYCKRLQIILEPDNSVTMKTEICDHLLLLLAAILNKPEGKSMYSKFLDSLQHLWMPTSLNTPILQCDAVSSQLEDYGMSLEQCNRSNAETENEVVSDNSDNVFNFTDGLFAHDIIPDFPDINLNIKCPKLNTTITSTCDDLALNILQLNTVKPLSSLPVAPIETATKLDTNFLSVIDQFQLDHNMQMSNDNTDLSKDVERINNLDPIVAASTTSKQQSLLKTSVNNTNYNEEFAGKPCIILNARHEPKTVPIKNSKASKLPTVRCIKIDSPNNNVVKQPPNTCHAIPLTGRVKSKQTSSVSMPSMSYQSWIDHVIEILNENITISNRVTIKNTFHVPDAIFNHFSKSFIINNERTLPHNTQVVKSEKYKNHIKYTWYLNQASTVQQIFASKNIKVELERSYQRLADGSYKLYTPPATFKLADKKYFKPIYPKIQIYKVFVPFAKGLEVGTNDSQPHKYGLKLEWLPSVFPKSKFGLMTIEYCVSVKECIGSM